MGGHPPKHVNINTLEMMPVSQSFAGLSVPPRANRQPPGLMAGYGRNRKKRVK